MLETADALKEQPVLPGNRVELEAEVDPTRPTGTRAKQVALLPT